MTAHRLLLVEDEPSLARTLSDRLLDEVWGYDATPTTRTVDVHVSSLRQKIEPSPGRPRFIVTVHGLGYRLDG